MKPYQNLSQKIITVAAVAALFTACSSAPTRPPGADQLRAKLTQLQSDPQLASRAAVAITDAESAVVAAEEPQKDAALSEHLVIIADRKLQIAEARAQARLFEDQRVALSQKREQSRLDSRTQEADRAQQQNVDLQKQIADLNAKETERGLVVTIGDLQFSTGKAQLREGASNHLVRLADYLRSNKDRYALIEGHTDSVGSEQLNETLSRKRAETVKAYLISQGIDPNRLSEEGKGEAVPVASNDSASGRQQNRRVEIVIAEPQS